MIPYFFINILAFYALPWLIHDTGTAMGIMLIIFPAICLMTALFYGIKQGFHWLYAVVISLLFLPSVFLIYNESAMFYTYAYGMLALVGNLIGACMKK